MTTHTGSLPRPPELLTMLLDGVYEGTGFERLAIDGVAGVVQKQMGM